MDSVGLPRGSWGSRISTRGEALLGDELPSIQASRALVRAYEQASGAKRSEARRDGGMRDGAPPRLEEVNGIQLQTKKASVLQAT